MPERAVPTTPSGSWVADPSIPWRIVLTADLTTPLARDHARARLSKLHHDQGWSGTGSLHIADDLHALRRDLGNEREGVVALGLSADGRRVIVSAHHSGVDGLGLLAVLSALAAVPVTSSARGVGERPDSSGPVGTIARRLVEVAATPPARIAAARPAAPDPLDVYVERDVPGAVRTAALVVAGARGVAAYNRTRDPRRRTRHVAVAVGVTRDATADSIADRSALLRLRDVERLGVETVAAALGHAATQRAVQGSGGGAGLLRLGLRALAPRLGSTLLVSHLGMVSAPGVESMTFHPVTAGGTGVSLGAVTLVDTRAATTAVTTRLTLRARGTAWTHDGLERLLEAVVIELRP